MEMEPFVVSDGENKMVIADGKVVAIPGAAGSPKEAGQWVSVDPAYEVSGDIDSGELSVDTDHYSFYDPPRKVARRR